VACLSYNKQFHSLLLFSRLELITSRTRADSHIVFPRSITAELPSPRVTPLLTVSLSTFSPWDDTLILALNPSLWTKDVWMSQYEGRCREGFGGEGSRCGGERVVREGKTVVQWGSWTGCRSGDLDNGIRRDAK
jgi:hypothetical protein